MLTYDVFKLKENSSPLVSLKQNFRLKVKGIQPVSRGRAGKTPLITCTKAVCDLNEDDLWSFVYSSFTFWLCSLFVAVCVSSNPIYRPHIHLWSLLSSDVGDVSVCPPVALESGVGLVCRLFELSGQVPAGIRTLTEWLLGEEEGNEKAVSDASSLVSVRLCSNTFVFVATVSYIKLTLLFCRTI